MPLLITLYNVLFGADALAAIGQNVAASALYDLMKGAGSLPLPQRWQSGDLPVNHDIERIAGDCLRRTLHFAATSLASELGREPSLVSRVFCLGRFRELLGSKPEPEDRWVDTFLNAALDHDKVAALDAAITLPVDDIAGALRPGDSTPRRETRAAFAKAVSVWASHHVGAVAPQAWALNLERGFLPRRGGGGRIPLFDAWLLFIREALKTDDRVFRAFVIQTLSQGAQTPDASAIAGDAAGAILASVGKQLDAALDQHRAWFDEKFGLVQKQLDAIVTNDAAAIDKLDRLLASVGELHAKIGDTRAENEILREEIARLRSEQSNHPEAAQARLNLQSVALGALSEKQSVAATAPNPDAARQTALVNVASQLNVEVRTVQLALEEFASNARRQEQPSTAAKELGRKVEKEFNVRPAVVRPPQQNGSFFTDLLKTGIALLLLWALNYYMKNYYLPEKFPSNPKPLFSPKDRNPVLDDFFK